LVTVKRLLFQARDDSVAQETDGVYVRAVPEVSNKEDVLPFVKIERRERQILHVGNDEASILIQHQSRQQRRFSLRHGQHEISLRVNVELPSHAHANVRF
jgi:hypothetical protein